MMNRNNRKRKPGQRIYEYERRASFQVGDTSLVIEDRINTLLPWSSERMMWIEGTDAYYSVVPLCPAWHELLSFTYCEDLMKKRDAAFYQHVLVLGLGGGAVPRWVLEEYPFVMVDVVDKSPEIIDICKTYFISRWADCERLKIVCTDAREYEPPAYRYQFMFCDMFDGRTLAPVVYERPFARKLSRMISEEGVLVINCGWHDLNEIMEVYGEAFGYLKILRREPGQTQVLMASESPFPEGYDVIT